MFQDDSIQHAPRAISVTCPKCGSEVRPILTCTNCGNEYTPYNVSCSYHENCYYEGECVYSTDSCDKFLEQRCPRCKKYNSIHVPCPNCGCDCGELVDWPTNYRQERRRDGVVTDRRGDHWDGAAPVEVPMPSIDFSNLSSDGDNTYSHSGYTSSEITKFGIVTIIVIAIIMIAITIYTLEPVEDWGTKIILYIGPIGTCFVLYCIGSESVVIGLCISGAGVLLHILCYLRDYIHGFDNQIELQAVVCASVVFVCGIIRLLESVFAEKR